MKIPAPRMAQNMTKSKKKTKESDENTASMVDYVEATKSSVTTLLHHQSCDKCIRNEEEIVKLKDDIAKVNSVAKAVREGS